MPVYPGKVSRQLAPFWICCVLAGCGDGPVTIEGSVTLDGEPLPGVQILFDQPDVADGNGFSGRTDDVGHFALQSVKPELRRPVAGTYRVSLTTAVLGRDALENARTPPERIPKKYRNGALEFELPEGGTLDAAFELKSK